MSNLREFTYPSSDGVHQIHAAEWTPDITEPRGVVQLVHGISEYILRYAPFAEYLTRYGFIVVGDDQVLARMAANDRQQRRYSGLRARLARTAEPAEPAPEQLQL